MEPPAAPLVEVRLPRHLVAGWGVPPRLEVRAASLGALWEALESRCPGLTRRLLDDQGTLRRHLLLFHNETSVGNPEAGRLPLRAGDRLHVVASVSGG